MIKKEKITFGIYGCGMIASLHAMAVREIPNAALIGAADINYDRALSFAKKEKIEAFNSFDDMLSSKKIDTVCICTPSGTHKELAIRALDAGKNVVLEKPMAFTSSDCDEIIEACKRSQKKLMVISQLRTLTDVKRAKKIIDSGALGKITVVNANMKYYRSPDYYKDSWRGTRALDGGGALMNQGIHGLDLVCYLAGKIKNAKAFSKTLVHDIEVEDTLAACLEFECGAVGIIEATTSVYPGFNRKIEICGSLGSIIMNEGEIEYLAMNGEIVEERTSKNKPSGSSNPSNIKHMGHKNQIQDFVNLLSGCENIDYCDEYQGKITIEAIEKIYNNSN